MLDKDAKPTPQIAQTRNSSRVSRQRPSSRGDAPAGKLTLQQGEPEDAFVTGGSRSLQRRCLGLNIPAANAVVPMLLAKAKKHLGKPITVPAR